VKLKGQKNPRQFAVKILRKLFQAGVQIGLLPFAFARLTSPSQRYCNAASPSNSATDAPTSVYKIFGWRVPQSMPAPS
jgi:hypothetical protein